MSSRNVSIKVQGEVIEVTDVQKVGLDRTASELVAVYHELSDVDAGANDVRTGKKIRDKYGNLVTGTYDGGGGGGDDPNGLPIIKETSEEMMAVRVASNIGKYYKYVPTITEITSFRAGETYQVYDDSAEDW